MAIFDEFQVARILASTSGLGFSDVLDGLDTTHALGGGGAQAAQALFNRPATRVCYDLQATPQQSSPVIRQLAATLGGTQAQLDEKYGTGASSTSITPNQPTTILGPPNQVIPSGDDMQNFSCPTNASDCLAAIPRTDAVDLYSTLLEPGKTTDDITINLDDARGMQMQDICALINVVPLPAAAMPDPPPTAAQQAQFYQQLFFLGHWTLVFRDTEVPGFKQRPLSDIAEKPGCCDEPCAHVGCVVPEYGGMVIRLNLVEIPIWVDRVEVLVRVNFTGCPTNKHAGCGCGCGGNPVARNPFITTGQLGI